MGEGLGKPLEVGGERVDVRTSENNVLIKNKIGNTADCFQLFFGNETSLQRSTTQTTSSSEGQGQASGPVSAGS